jgi:hypothetical protein
MFAGVLLPHAFRLSFIALAAVIAVAVAVAPTERARGSWSAPVAGAIVSISPDPAAAVQQGADVIVTGWILPDPNERSQAVDVYVDGELAANSTARPPADLGGTAGKGRRAFTIRIATRNQSSGTHHASLWLRTESGRLAPLPASIDFNVTHQ